MIMIIIVVISIIAINLTFHFPVFLFYTSKPIPFFHRCVPMDSGCKNIKALATFVSYNSVLQRVITGVMTSKEIIVGLCLMSLGNDSWISTFYLKKGWMWFKQVVLRFWIILF